MSRTRRHFAAAQKALVVSQRLADKVAGSNLAYELQVQFMLIDFWIEHVLNHAATAFKRPEGNASNDTKNEWITQLEESWSRRTMWWPN